MYISLSCCIFCTHSRFFLFVSSQLTFLPLMLLFSPHLLPPFSFSPPPSFSLLLPPAPPLTGIPLPVCMFLFVLCATLSCLTLGCYIARTTDILKVNKEEAGAAAKPIDEDVPDNKGYDWRNKN